MKQEQLIQLQMIEQEASQLEQQLRLIEQHLAEMEQLKKGLKEIDESKLASLPGIKCPYCGYRILYKKRPSIIKRIKAI